MKRNKQVYFLLILLLDFSFLLLFGLNTSYHRNTQIQVDPKKEELEFLNYPLTSAWTANGAPVCTDSNNQLLTGLCSDENGGTIIVWLDNRSGLSYYNIYAQRFNSTGDPLWANQGEPVCTNDSDKYASSRYTENVISDGVGGAIIAWRDDRNGNWDIYAQRIDSDGNIHSGWDTDGVAICTHTSYQNLRGLVSDGDQGAIIYWEDDRNPGDSLYAQRIYYDGTLGPMHEVGWKIDGTVICNYGSMIQWPHICSDNAGGAIIAWGDFRHSIYSNSTPYAQRIDAFGNPRWKLNGKCICTVANIKYDPYPILCSDGAGGAIIAWNDNRTGGEELYYDIYTQRLNSTGDSQWTDQGVPICTENFDQWPEDIAGDGNGGAVVVWNDERTGSKDIYAQKVSASGTVRWKSDGIGVSTFSGIQEDPVVCCDDNGNAIIAWQDYRYDVNGDIYAQCICSQGTPKWTSNGIVISNIIDGNMHRIHKIINGKGGTGFIAWTDIRNGVDNTDIYAYKLGPCQCIIPQEEGDDDNGHGKKREEAIPGYQIYLIIGLLCISVIIYYRKYQNKLHKF